MNSSTFAVKSLCVFLLVVILSGCGTAAPTIPNPLPSPLPTVEVPTAPPPVETLSAAGEASPTPELTGTPAAEVTPSAPAQLNEPPHSFAGAISADGRFLAFTSHDGRLVENDTNGFNDAFVYDRTSGTVERVSVSSDGAESDGYVNIVQDISADGRLVLFSSDATNLIPNKTDRRWQLYLRNRESHTTEVIQISSDQDEMTYSTARGKMSADGRYVVVEASADLMVGGRQDYWNIFLYDRETGSAEILSAAPDGSPADGMSTTGVISADGQWIVFMSSANNLVENDQTDCPKTDETGNTVGCGDIFVVDRANDLLERIPAGLSLDSIGGASTRLSISADGRFVAYDTPVRQGSGEIAYNVVVFDRLKRSTELVCAEENGVCSGFGAALSQDGRWMAFSHTQVYSYELETRQMAQVSLTSDGTPADAPSGILLLSGEGFNSDVQISADGQWIAFASQAANLLPEGTEKRVFTMPGTSETVPVYDVFLHNRESGETIWVNRPLPQ